MALDRSAVALICGAAGAIGEAVARTLLVAGYSVSLGLHDLEDYPRTEWAGRELGEPSAAYRQGFDVQNELSMRALARNTMSELGGLDAVVYNAGAYLNKPITATRSAQWDQVVNTTLRGAFLCIRESAMAWAASRSSGNIVIIGSVHGNRSSPGHIAYASSKAGLQGLVRTAAVELASTGTRVNLVSPGAIASGGNLPRVADPAYQADLARQVPMRRIGTPQEVAEVVEFLLSERSSYVTGVDLAVDGGLLLYPFNV
jgi:3-oxoacyl-[acyl-carrier protein] reductase